MEDQQLELWQSLDAAAQFPETADLRSLCNALEQSLHSQSLTEQLIMAGDVLVQCSEVYVAKANLLMSRWERQHNPTEPIVDLEHCIDLFVQSLSLNVADLFEEAEPVVYPANRKEKLEGDSIVAEVDKNTMLNWVDQMAAEQPLTEEQIADQIIHLAHGENVEEWSRTISQYLQQFQANIRLPDLQKALEIFGVELWLGLLMGGFSLEQQGEFYTSQNLWIINRDVAMPEQQLGV